MQSETFTIPANTPVYIPCLTYDAYSNSGWSSYFDNFIINGPTTSDTTFYSAVRCYGVPFTDRNFTSPLYMTGIHYKTLVNVLGCDSVVCLTLSEYEPVPVTDYEASFCQGGSYSDKNFTDLIHAGYHQVILQNVNGCDSIVRLTLMEYEQIPITDYEASFCQGGSYSDKNFTDLIHAGYHQVTLQNVNGCDSIVRVNLAIIPAPVYDYEATICQGSEYNDANFTGLTATGLYQATLKALAGCDSIVQLQLYVVTPPVQALCMISVDMEYHNEIVWRRQDEVTAYNIYREGNTIGQYELMTTIPYEEANSWLDTESNARVRSYTYMVSAIDTCGNESALSAPHKTMHLTINQGMGSWNLIWTPYEGTGYSTYNIYRAVGETYGELTLIGSIPSSLTSYTDFISTGNDYVYYMVEIVLDNACEVGSVTPIRSAVSKAGNSESSYGVIRSNIATNNPDGIPSDTPTSIEIRDAEHPIQVYPNPFTGEIRITGADGCTLRVINSAGVAVHIQMINTSEETVRLEDLPAGVYFFRFEKDGQSQTVKTVKN